ncbi:conjugative transposon protein TraM [Maribacter polysaccharolyticus]|uniref:conjugative transposon protein TraM n=1 Tax=Maribacter polysaccharolyticus TaxID=3020831 RepID=UPI00237F1319|nr:conjugative transposon protein TraM [Maribacter polysaccharolyticus]MDE3744036.1 conjugative transposon protein TraM [Maribacter polysaccharolyticus]
MAKIDIKQPKYILPMIVLPFLILFFFVYRMISPDEMANDDLQTTAGINSEIPNPMLEKKEPKNKLEAFRDELLEKRKYSRTMVIGEELEKKTKNEVISPEEQRKIDSLQKVIAERKTSYRSRQPRTSKTKTKAQQTSRSSPYPRETSKQGNKEKSEKEAFIEQMRIIDSIQNPEKYRTANHADSIQKEVPKIQKISLNPNSDADYFNTVKKNMNETHITALLDEGIKVYDGSRVRIRLLQDTFIEDYLLKKGKHLYGQVSGFKSQRVEVKINSIMVADSIVPVKISLYDNDGIRGIYVPDSQFRDFVSDLGVGATQSSSTMGNNIGQGSGTTSQQLYRSVSRSINSATKAMAKALKKNKAFLKYNTQVYLINE